MEIKKGVKMKISTDNLFKLYAINQSFVIGLCVMVIILDVLK